MWLYVPYLSAQEQEVSTSGSSSPPTCAPSVGWNGKPMSPRAWRREWKTGSLTRRLSGLTCEPSTLARGAESWISSLRDTRASRSASQASSEGQTTRCTSGRTSSGPCETQGLLFSSPRTCEDTSLMVCGKFSGTFPASGSMRSGTCSARKRRERLTAARGSSCLRLWPTPQARDHRSESSQGRRKSPNLPVAVGGALNPTWVE